MIANSAGAGALDTRDDLPQTRLPWIVPTVSYIAAGSAEFNSSNQTDAEGQS